MVGRTSAWTSAWIWCTSPAAMLLTSQQASFLRGRELGTLRSAFTACSAPASITACVCASLPVTRLPSARSAASTTCDA
eukprot:1194412-Prorocentrum_minimum.AAC.6